MSTSCRFSACHVVTPFRLCDLGRYCQSTYVVEGNESLLFYCILGTLWWLIECSRETPCLPPYVRLFYPIAYMCTLRARESYARSIVSRRKNDKQPGDSHLYPRVSEIMLQSRAVAYLSRHGFGLHHNVDLGSKGSLHESGVHIVIGPCHSLGFSALTLKILGRFETTYRSNTAELAQYLTSA
jgi:hypothetical protein